MSYGNYNIYYSSPRLASQCSIIQLPVKVHTEKEDINLTAEYDLEVHVSDAYSSCYSRGGLCELDNKRKFHCAITEKGMNIGITQKYLVLQLHTYTENAYGVLSI